MSGAHDANLVQTSADASGDDSQPFERHSHQRMIRKESANSASLLSPTPELSSAEWRDHSRRARGTADKDHEESLLSVSGGAKSQDDGENASSGNRTSNETITQPATEVHTHHTSGRKVVKNLKDKVSTGGLVFNNNERIVMSLEDWLKHALLLT